MSASAKDETIAQDVNENKDADVVQDDASQSAGQNESDVSVRIRIDLPPAPAPQLSLSEEGSNSKGSSPKEAPHCTMTAICNPTERVFELKNLVKELDGFWLGAFSFVRGAPNQVNADNDNLDAQKPFEDWVDVATIFQGSEYDDPSVPKVLKVVEIPYDPLEIRAHILRVNDILNNTQTSLRSRQMNRGPVFERDALALEQGISYHSIIRDSVASSGEDLPKVLRSQPSEPLAGLIQLREKLASVPQAAACVKSFALSPFNPPTQTNRMRGHLIYLDIVTLEKQTIHIVGTTSGFYVSDSSPPSTFKLSSKANAFPSLFYLLASKSPAFLASMKDIFPPEPVAAPDNLAAAEAHSASTAKPWLVMPPQPSADLFYTQLDFLKSGHTVPDATPYERNWNQEFVLMKELPKDTLQERINRERFLARLQSDMSEFAAKTVAGIVQGDISVANPNDPPALQTLVHHNLLFVPSKDALEAFGHLGGDEAVRVTSAKDVSNASILSNADIPGLHLSPSVCVDYLGQRWFCQSLTPGLLSSDRDTWEEEGLDPSLDQGRESGEARQVNGHVGDAQQQDEQENVPTPSTESQSSTLKILYGSVDTDHPEKAYAASPEFEPLAKQVADLMSLDKHEVHDIEGRATALWLSGEVKGVLGQDNNKYLLDLYRLQPVDVNFLEAETVQQMFANPYDASPASPVNDATYPHRLVLLRPELLQRYQATQAALWRQEQGDKEEKKKNDDKSEGELQSSVPEGDDEKFLEVRFNPDAFVDRLNEAGGVPEDESKPSTKHVRQAAELLLTQALPVAVRELATSSFPMDGQHLTQVLHEHGINMRYLGRLASLCKSDKVPKLSNFTDSAAELQLRALLRVFEQEMVLRGTKHVLRHKLEHLDLVDLPFFLSHFLNCLLGASSDPKAEAEVPSFRSTAPSWASLDSATLHSDIAFEVARRFRYTLPADWFTTQLREVQLLREVCLRCGIQLRLRTYQFSPQKNVPSHEAPLQPSTTRNKGKGKGKTARKPPVQPQPTPATTVSFGTAFVPDDILQVYPIVKGMHHRSFLSDQFDICLGNIGRDESQSASRENLCAESISLAEQVYGVVHPEPARMYHKLGNFYGTVVQHTRDQMWQHERARSAGQSQLTRADGSTQKTWTDEECESAKNNLFQYSKWALSMQRQSFVISERVNGTYSHQAAEQLFSLGYLEGLWGSAAQGLEYLSRAREILDLIYGVDHPMAADWAIHLASVALRHHQMDLSDQILSDALALAERTSGQKSVSYARMLLARAASKLQVRQRLSSEVLEELTRATELLSGLYTPDSNQILEAQITLLTAKQMVSEQETRDRNRVGSAARRLGGVDEKRAQELLEIRQKKNGASNSALTGTGSATAAATGPGGKHLSDMPLDYLADYVNSGSSKTVKPPPTARTSGKGKGAARKKKH